MGVMARFRIIIGAALAAIAFANSAEALFLEKEIKKGNRFYSEEKYEDALKNYDEALSAKPEDAVLQYNRASALYRVNKFKEAEEGFLNALALDSDKIEGESAYNVGNSKYRLGANSETGDASSAMEHYKQSAQFYKRAIEVNTRDTDAKYKDRKSVV